MPHPTHGSFEACGCHSGAMAACAGMAPIGSACRGHGAHDVGLLLRSPHLSLDSLGRGSRADPGIALPCGRLFRFVGSAVRDADCGAEALRLPKTVVTLAADGAGIAVGPPAVSSAARTEQLVVDARGFDMASPALRAFGMRLLSLLAEEPPLPGPVLLQGAVGAQALVDLAVLLLLKACGVSEEQTVALHERWPGARREDALQALQTLGGEGCGLEALWPDHSAEHLRRLRRLFFGDDGDEVARAAAELAWLKDDLRRSHRLALTALEQATDVVAVGAARAGSVAAFWCGELSMAGAALVRLAPSAQEAAAGLYFRGWALLRLGEPTAAREALEFGSVLSKSTASSSGSARRESLLKELVRELAALPAGLGLARSAQVVDAKEASAAADAGRRVFVFDGGVATSSEARGWQLLAAPLLFSWAVFDPPALLAVSTSPALGDAAATEALQLLGLKVRIAADGGLGSKVQPPVESIVEQVARCLQHGNGCLLHCADGGVASGTALACFLCKYGFGNPEDWDVQEPTFAAADAVEYARGFRGAAAVDEALVNLFEQSVRSEMVMSRIAGRGRRGPKSGAGRGTGGAAAAGPSKDALVGQRLPKKTKLVRQPGDGNCLFHSLAHVLPGKIKAASLRKKICEYMEDFPALDISGTPLAEWVQMASQSSVEDYSRRMQRTGEWGGAPEIAVCARMEGLDVCVYQPVDDEFELMAEFLGGGSGSSIVHILYSGRMHYDALMP